MLTKTDLNQIQKIVKTEVQGETRKIVREETSKIVQSETRKIVKEELVPIKEDITHIRKDIKTIVNYFDREYLNLRKRVERIEDHLNLSQLSS